MVRTVFYILLLLLCTQAIYAVELDKAKKLRESGKVDEAIASLKESGAGDIESQKLLAKLYLDKGMFSEASQVYSQICSSVNTHDCYNEFGIASLSVRNYPQAISNFQKAIELQKDSSTAHSNLAQAYYLQNEMEKAEEAHATALELAPFNPITRINFGVFLVKQKKFQQAKEVLYTVVGENKTMYYAELYLGIAHYHKEEYNMALIHLNRGIAINPDYYDLYYYRALVYYKRGEYSSSLEDLKTVDKLYPTNIKTAVVRKVIKKNIKI
ncbi:MAG: tetratricopeptide repeat protein [Leptospiraceae bacterium]|nr:tetratricopeptide repeat protein [Leptospiraceae bacterium]